MIKTMDLCNTGVGHTFVTRVCECGKIGRGPIGDKFFNVKKLACFLPSTGTRSCVAFIYSFHAEALCFCPGTIKRTVFHKKRTTGSNATGGRREFIKNLKKVLENRINFPQNISIRIFSHFLSKIFRKDVEKRY